MFWSDKFNGSFAAFADIGLPKMLAPDPTLASLGRPSTMCRRSCTSATSSLSCPRSRPDSRRATQLRKQHARRVGNPEFPLRCISSVCHGNSCTFVRSHMDKFRSGICWPSLCCLFQSLADRWIPLIPGNVSRKIVRAPTG